jgi:capsular exopolysaccharide synthesis family protein
LSSADSIAPKERQLGLDESASNASIQLRVFRKHWPIIVACVLVLGGISLVISKMLPRIYQAEAMLEIDPSANRPLAEKSESVMPLGTGNYLDSREYFETQLRIITSTRVLEAAVRDAGLQNDWSFAGFKAPPPKPSSIETTATILRGRVAVEMVRNSRLVMVRVEDTNPKRARALCKAIAQAYIDQNLERAISSTSDSVTWLNGQVETVRKDLETNENALHSFKEKNDLPSTSINESSNMVRVEMQDLNTALTRTRTRKQELLARHAELSKITTENADVLPASELLSNSYLQTLRKDYLEGIRKRRELIAEGKGENHPQVKALDEKTAESRSALVAEVKNIQGAVERDLAVIEREELGESGLYDRAHKKAVDLNMKEIEYHRLDRSRDQNEKLYGLMLERMKDADLARMMKVNNIHLVEEPVEPGGPIRPRTTVNLAIGIALGLLLGIALASLKTMLDSTLKTPEDVERTLGVTFLGLLPSIDETTAAEKKHRKKRRLRAQPRSTLGENIPLELIVHKQPMSGLAEAARSIRTNLMFTNPDKPFKKLLVTSSAPSEGKTTVACSIAIALAQSGQRVCIIDCDLRRPRLHRIFDRAGDAGVTNVLVGEESLAAVAKPTIVPNLWCIPSGPTPPNPADLLHSDRFKKFLEDAGEMFDRIVLDSPPLVAVTDSAIISRLVDGTVFVLRAFATARALARQGIRTLADVDAPIVGAVLNAVDLSRHEYSYYYQYYYYKREGYAASPDDDGDGPGPAAAPDLGAPSTN